MSSTANLIGGHERVAYTIEHRGGCVLITGAVPMDKFGVLTMLAPKNAVMDADAATVLGVTFAFGLPDDLQALRAAATPSYERGPSARRTTGCPRPPRCGWRTVSAASAARPCSRA